HPETRPAFPRAVADDQKTPWSDAAGKMRQERVLRRLGQIVKHIKESNVAGENRNRSEHVLVSKIDIVIVGGGDPAPVANLARIQIEPEHRLAAGAFAKVKGQQADAAPDIENGIL